MRARVVAVAAVVVIGGGAAAAIELTASEPADARLSNQVLPPATASVERGDLVSSTSVDGTLGYTKQKKINAGTAGTFTWVTGSGSAIKRDGRLYAVDGRDVRLMYGAEPVYRNLKKGDEGNDVRQLKANLIALGLGGGIVEDREFTDGTVEAVKRWQKSHDRRQTGTIGPGDIAFAPGAVRIQKPEATVGDLAAPGQTVLSTTGSERVVQIKVKVGQAPLVKVGSKVRVQLPGQPATGGTVSSVGTTAQTGSDGDDSTPRISVTVTFDDPSGITGVDKSPASVELTGERRKDVLSVPVSALLALRDGSFGVQVVQDGRTRETTVRLGMFAQGRVEVSGGGLRDGMKVGVPKI